MRRFAHARTGLAAALAAALGFAACAPADDPDALLADLNTPDLEVRQEAADKIEAVVARNDHDVFIRGLESANPLHRAQSILYLSRMSSPEARAELRGLLAIERRMLLPYNPVRLRPQGEMSDSRILVAGLIQRTRPDPEAIGVLLKGAEEGQTAEIIAGTCFAVGALRDSAGIGFLARASRHPDPRVVRAAVQALGMFAVPEAIEALRGASTHSMLEVRSDVVSALSARDDDLSRSILKSMGSRDESIDLRASAWQVLSRFQGDDIVPYFIDRLRDVPPEARPAVVDILARLTGRNLGPKPEAWARFWSSRPGATPPR